MNLRKRSITCERAVVEQVVAREMLELVVDVAAHLDVLEHLTQLVDILWRHANVLLFFVFFKYFICKTKGLCSL